MSRIRALSVFPALLAGALLCIASAAAQTPQAARTQPTTASVPAGAAVDTSRIIAAFTKKEGEYRRVLNDYSFQRDAVIQTIGLGGQVTGEFHRTSRFLIDDNGNKYEKILFFPVPTLQEVQLTAEDLEDLSGVNQFTLEAKNLDKYNFTYVGKEKIDELNTYIFDVAPKVLPEFKKTKERYFQGRIWVDDHDLQIVKSKGKGVPEDKNNKFPIVETYRENIDGRYWFPTYAYADDQLVFNSGQVVHLRVRIKYTDFQRVRGRVRIIEEGEPGAVDATPQQQTLPSQKPPQTQPSPAPKKP